MKKKLSNQSRINIKNIFRWVSFVPGSIFVALIVWFLFSRPMWLVVPSYIMLLFLPSWTIPVAGVAATIFSYVAATVALLSTAYWIIPFNKKRTVKIYSIIIGILIALFAAIIISAYFEGSAGYLWPIMALSLILGYSIGVYSYSINIDKEQS